METAVMLLQEVRNWAGRQGVLTRFELIWTLLLPYRGTLHVTFWKKSYRKGKLLSFCLALSGVRFIFLVMGTFLKMTCGRS